ncbi:MAG: FkbM family methyltransferase [Kofleriaceae bacterium]
MLRDLFQFRLAKPRDLSHGIKLMGDAKMAADDYEVDQTRFIINALGSADVFVDVGANIGYYTCLARRHGLTVVAFEPSTTAIRFLYANLLANGLRDVEVLPLGASDKIDLVPLFGTGGSASLVPGWSRASAAYSTVISTTTLDHVLANRFLDKRMFIKIDVEGGELACLRGARETIARAIAPVWFVEIYLDTGLLHNAHFAETFELFWQHGYNAKLASVAGEPVTRSDVQCWIAGTTLPPGFNFTFSRP